MIHRTVLLLCAALLLISAGARADIVVPGTKKITVAVHVDLGAYRDRAALEHVVQEGDTLSALAREFLGDERRVSEVREWNPSLEDSLSIGESLLLPPKDRNTPPIHFFTISVMGGDVPARLRSDGMIPDHHYGRKLLAVEQAHLEKFVAILADWDQLKREEWPPAWLFVSPSMSTRSSVRDSPFAKDSDELFLRVVHVADGDITFEKLESGDLPEKRRAMVIQSGLAAAALLGLILLARHRRS